MGCIFRKIRVVDALPPRMERLATLVEDDLKKALLHGDPRQALPNVIALLLQLNSEANSSRLNYAENSEADRAKRQSMRNEILNYINVTIVIGAEQDIQQIAYALRLVTVKYGGTVRCVHFDHVC